MWLNLGSPSRLILSLFLLLIFFSCEKNSNNLEFEIGNNLINPDSKITICDTFSVNLSTIKKDSLITSGADSLLIGRLKDNRLGDIISRCYFRFTVPSTSTIQEEDVYDSVCLVVRINGYSYGDTSIYQTWNVRELTEDLESNDDGNLYNTSSFSYDTIHAPLGSIRFKAYPSRKQEIAIPLNHEFGKSLFDMKIDNDDKLSSSSEFCKYFKGVILEPGDKSMNTLLGISLQDTSIIMRIYAHRNGEERQDLELDFNMETGSLPFAQITCNRENSVIKNLTNQRYGLPSDSTNNESFIQGGVGLMTRIDIPGLANLLEKQKTALIKAELILKPVVGSYEISRLPTKLIFTKCDKLNRILNAYYNDDASDYLYGNLVKGSDLYNENTCYTIDITKYVKDELSDNYFEPYKTGLLLYYWTPSFHVTASRIVFGDCQHENQKAQLKLYFLNY